MDKRIELLASLSSNSKILLDIGCDHGYTVIEAVKKYNVDSAYAIDVSDGPLENAKRNIISNNLTSKITTLKSDGFKEINFSFDCAIISGMGGLLIIDLLKESMSKLKECKLILQPNTDVCLVREFLYKNNFKIIDEANIFSKGHYYEIIVAKYSNKKQDYCNLDVLFGPINRLTKSDDFKIFYRRKLDRLRENIKKVNDLDSKKKLEREFFLINQVIED